MMEEFEHKLNVRVQVLPSLLALLVQNLQMLLTPAEQKSTTCACRHSLYWLYWYTKVQILTAEASELLQHAWGMTEMSPTGVVNDLPYGPFKVP